jgi:enoyl-CoA hydratase
MDQVQSKDSLLFNTSIKISYLLPDERIIIMRILLEKDGPHIAIITIDHQKKLNAMSREMMQRLGNIWDELSRDETRCIILTGAGERAFCVGADISGDLEATPEISKIVNHALLKTDIFKKPIIGAVNGDCIGGGLELLLPTDIRVTSPNARFGLPEVKWSIYPFGGATIKLIQQIGYVQAMDLLLTGRLISAEEARQIGLVNDIKKTGSVLDWALEKAHMIVANSPSAVQAVKTQISSSIAEHVRSREDLDQKLGDQVRAGPNFKEGVNAFLEKRQPKY